MTQAPEQLKNQLSELPEEDRVELARFLLGTLDEEADTDFQEAWVAELDRRQQEMQRGQVIGVPMEEALSRLREKLG